MDRKKVIHQEYVHPFLFDRSKENALNLIEDYIKAELSDDEIFQNKIEECKGEIPLISFVPMFQYEGDFCPLCGKVILHVVKENRELECIFCPMCGEMPFAEPMKSFLAHLNSHKRL